MARKLAHDDGESGQDGDDRSGGDGALHLNRRKYVKLGAVAVAAVGSTSGFGGVSGETADGTTYWTDFGGGSL